CAATGLLVSPITWAHHLVWIVPALVWLVLAADRPVFGLPLAIAGWVLFALRPIWLTPNEHNRELAENGWQLVVGNVYFLTLCVFIAGTALLLLLRARRPTRSAPRTLWPRMALAPHHQPAGPLAHADERAPGHLSSAPSP